MCLSIPAKVTEISGSGSGARGVADVAGNRVEVDLSLVEDARVGDYVLVHAGFALQKYDLEEARAILAMLKGNLRGTEK